MPKRYLQYMKRETEENKRFGQTGFWQSNNHIARNRRRMVRANARTPMFRANMRHEMMERLRTEVKEREVQELMNKMEIGVTPQKRSHKKKVV